MILRTDSYDNLEEDVARVLNVDKEDIRKKICEFDKKWNLGDGPNSNWDAFNDEITNLIISYASLNILDEIYVYHLTRMIHKEKQLAPLNKLLLEESALSCFLRDYGIVFRRGSNNEIFLYYKNKYITPDVIISSGNGLLARRLGYYKNKDYYINGFTFWPDINKTASTYYEELKLGPEFIRSLDSFLGTNMCDVYHDKTLYYGMVLRVPICDVYFEVIDKQFTKDEKVVLLLKYALLTLHGYYYKFTSSSNNPIIRIIHEQNLMVDYFIEIND